MRKSASKRIRVTKNGKILRRKMASGHNRTRKTSKLIRSKKKTTGLNHPKKIIINY
jgi:ribosomal protein L35